MKIKLVDLVYLLSHSLPQSAVFTMPWECNGRVFMLKYIQLSSVTLCRQNTYSFPGGFQNSEEKIISHSSFHLGLLLLSLTSKIWSPGASLPSRAASASRTISWMTMFPSGVSFPPTMRRPSSSSGSSLNSSTTLASATRLDRRGVLSGGKRDREPGRINIPVYETNTLALALSSCWLNLIS